MITALVIVAFLAVTCLLALGTGWNNVLSADRNELVFADRNREYGAYKIRQEYHRTMLLAMCIGLGLVGSGVLLPRLFADPIVETGSTSVIFRDIIFDAVTVDPVKPIEPVQPPKVQARIDPPVPGGMPVAVDSVVTTPIDTTSATPDPGPKGGDPGPKGGDPGPGSGPVDTGNNPNKGTKQAYEVDVMPEYPGGEKALYGYLSDEVDYPMIDVRNEVQGRVWVSFVVSEDGSIVDATLLTNVSPTIDAEALRVVRKMRKWKPGKVKGQDVNVRYKLPIVFRLAP